MPGRRHYLLNTNVPLAAYYGSPSARGWLRLHGGEAYYSSLLRVELRRLRQKGALPSVSAVLDVLRANNVEELSVNARRVLERARRLSDRGLFPRALVFDAAHVLIAKEYGLVIVSYDEDIGRLAGILGLPTRGPGDGRMARRIYPDAVVEEAVKMVREERKELSAVYVELEELAEKAGTAEAQRVVDEWLEGRIGDDEARRKLRALAGVR